MFHTGRVSEAAHAGAGSLSVLRHSGHKDDRECVCAFYSYALMGIVVRWISEGMTQRPESLARQVSAIMDGCFENSLSKLAKR